jgi:hypothetical protein
LQLKHSVNGKKENMLKPVFRVGVGGEKEVEGKED